VTVPRISEWEIRFACSEDDAVAAWNLFSKQQPKSVTLSEAQLSAEVEGHTVKITVGPNGSVVNTACTCYRTEDPPMWCSHVGAVFLWCAHHVRHGTYHLRWR
jgi:hypothetical protein